MPFKSADSLLPLTPISFEILLSLLDGERHGYAILQAVEARLAASLPLRTGTVYRALARLLDEDLIERSDGDGSGDDPRRRYYRITAHGRAVARADAQAPGRPGRRGTCAPAAAGVETVTIELARAVHRLALVAYPRKFRRQFAGELDRIFVDRLRSRI